MKVVLQRVLEASVKAAGKETGRIGKGYLALVGIAEGDTPEKAGRMAEKIFKLRIFQDAAGKTNLSAADVGGGILAVSQFTLYADCAHGNRPGFTGAASPMLAEALYECFLTKCRTLFPAVGQGVFGADMEVSLVNDGPFTVILEM